MSYPARAEGLGKYGYVIVLKYIINRERKKEREREREREDREIERSPRTGFYSGGQRVLSGTVSLQK